jgi:hypothetical protein
VQHLDPRTLKPYPNEFTVMRVKWYGHTWFYETLPGVWTNEEFLVKT